MTPEQTIKAAILTRAAAEGLKLSREVTAETVAELFDENNQEWELQDYISEMRSGEVETGLKCDWSRHYESKAVAAQMPDGRWVGWTYWYGGGKHGEPEAMPWMEDAYFLDCTEEQKLVTVRTFTKQEAAAAA